MAARAAEVAVAADAVDAVKVRAARVNGGCDGCNNFERRLRWLTRAADANNGGCACGRNVQFEHDDDPTTRNIRKHTKPVDTRNN